MGTRLWAGLCGGVSRSPEMKMIQIIYVTTHEPIVVERFGKFTAGPNCRHLDSFGRISICNRKVLGGAKNAPPSRLA